MGDDEAWAGRPLGPSSEGIDPGNSSTGHKSRKSLSSLECVLRSYKGIPPGAGLRGCTRFMPAQRTG